MLGVVRTEEEDRWQWGGESYTVKNPYLSLSESGREEPIWTKEVWNALIPSKLSIMVWRFLQNRLPTKENLTKRGLVSTHFFFFLSAKFF
jgi:hypothetical protein